MKIAVQLGNTRLGSGYFDHYQDMHQALKSARANMTLCKYVAGDDNSEYFTELVKLLTSGQILYKANRWWSISIVELLFVLQICATLWLAFSFSRFITYLEYK